MNDLDLIAEVAKKSGLLWIKHGRQTHPVWHEWVDDSVCVVGDGEEQPLPDVVDGDTVTLLLRSKTNRQLVASVEAVVETIRPDHDDWTTITTALKAGRLNLADSDHAVDRWARESRVLRLAPTETVVMGDDMATGRPATYPRLS